MIAPFNSVSATGTSKSTSVLLVEADAYEYVRAGFSDLLPLPSDTESHLYHVLRDTLAHPGSLARAQLAFGIMDRPGFSRARARSVAIAIEYFHTASLLFDDLPSMDNASERRGRPCPHIAYGDAAAQLGALGLITRAYALLWDAISELPPLQRVRATQLVEACLGVGGILNGQARDLNFNAGPHTPESALDAARGKTVTLIKLTTMLPALIAGAPDDVLDLLESLSEDWGLAYQILDDFKDCGITESATGKTIGRDAVQGRPNYVVAAGIARSRAELAGFLRESSRIIESLRALGWSHGAFDQLQELLERESRSIRDRLVAQA